MVISEAMSYELPVISTNIAGIPEMLTHEKEGFLIDPGDHSSAVSSLEKLFSSASLRETMGKAGKKHFDAHFDVRIMVERYREVMFQVAPPIVLVNMDGSELIFLKDEHLSFFSSFFLSFFFLILLFYSFTIPSFPVFLLSFCSFFFISSSFPLDSCLTSFLSLNHME